MVKININVIFYIITGWINVMISEEPQGLSRKIVIINDNSISYSAASSFWRRSALHLGPNSDDCMMKTYVMQYISYNYVLLNSWFLSCMEQRDHTVHHLENVSNTQKYGSNLNSSHQGFNSGCFVINLQPSIMPLLEE